MMQARFLAELLPSSFKFRTYPNLPVADSKKFLQRFLLWHAESAVGSLLQANPRGSFDTRFPRAQNPLHLHSVHNPSRLALAPLSAALLGLLDPKPGSVDSQQAGRYRVP